MSASGAPSTPSISESVFPPAPFAVIDKATARDSGETSVFAS